MAYRKNKQTIYSGETLIAKDCPKCNRVLPIENFSISRHYPDGHSSLCRLCTKRARDARDSEEGRKKLMLSRLKSSAKRQGLPFNLTLEDIVVPERCPILNIPLEFGKHQRDTSWRENSPSVDRIIPAFGYVKGNIVIISYRANRIKNDATIEELRAIADFYQTLVV